MADKHQGKPVLGYFRFLEKIEDGILMITLSIMGLTLGSQVLFRYFLNTPLIWSEELARYIQIWITFLAIGFGLRYKSHIAMTIVIQRIQERAQAVIRVVINLFLIVVFAVFFTGSLDFVSSQNQILSSAMKIPMSWVYISIPISCGLFIIHTGIDVFKDVKKLVFKGYGGA